MPLEYQNIRKAFILELPKVIFQNNKFMAKMHPYNMRFHKYHSPLNQTQDQSLTEA